MRVEGGVGNNPLMIHKDTNVMVERERSGTSRYSARGVPKTGPDTKYLQTARGRTLDGRFYLDC